MEANERESASRLYQEALNCYCDGHLRDAEKHCAEALRKVDAVAEAVNMLNTLAAIRLDRGRHREAREDAMAALERAGELDQPGSNAEADRARMQSISLIARCHMQAGDYHHARPLLERAYTMANCWLDPESREKVHLLDLLGKLSKESGHLYEAEEYYRKAIALAERVWEPFHGEVATCCLHLALLAENWVDGPDLEPFARRSYEIRCSLFGSTSPLAAAALTGLAATLAANGDDATAGEKFVHALAIFDRHYGAAADHAGVTAEMLMHYAICRRHATDHLIANGRACDAREFSDRAQAVFTRVLGASHPLVKQWSKDHDCVKKATPASSRKRSGASAWNWWRGFSFSR